MNYETGRVSEQLLLPGEEPGAGRRRRWLIIGAIVAAVLVAVIAWRAFSGGEAAPAAKGPRSDALPIVTVAVPGRQSVEGIISGTGSLAARRELPVGIAGEGGRVTRVLVEPGDWVGKGQVLATIDRSVQAQTAASLAAGINVARADAALAQAELDRAGQLVGRGFISKADVDRRAAARDAANARLRVAEAQLGETRERNNRLDIRAPEGGLVLTRAVEPGQIVSSASGTLFRVAQGGQMEMRAQLSESDLARLGVGVRAEVTPVGSTQSYPGQVWQVSPVIDPQSRQGIARIALSYDRALRPGGFATARILRGSDVAPQLPESAVLSDDAGSFVYILDAQDRAVRRAVTIGEVSDAGVAIASGLNGTERVVLSAGAFLSPGQRVKPTVRALKQQ